MESAEFGEWLASRVARYAYERAQADGLDEHTSLERAERRFAELLPQGPQTPDQLLCVALDDRGDRVAVVWVGPHPAVPDAAWVWDVEVDQDCRGRGYGRAVMLAAEDLARQLGRKHLGLHVFGANSVARHLYRSLGYDEVHVEMSKPLGPA